MSNGRLQEKQETKRYVFMKQVEPVNMKQEDGRVRYQYRVAETLFSTQIGTNIDAVGARMVSRVAYSW
jgi:hypothetical protein